MRRIEQLPWPPSVNHYWQLSGRGRRKFFRIGKRGIEYRRNVVEIIESLPAHIRKTLKGEIILRVYLYPPDKRRRDIDNVCKALLDALAHSGQYEDDFQIVELHLTREKVVRGGRVDVELSQRS